MLKVIWKQLKGRSIASHPGNVQCLGLGLFIYKVSRWRRGMIYNLMRGKKLKSETSFHGCHNHTFVPLQLGVTWAAEL